jgi:peroxiredoxin
MQETVLGPVGMARSTYEQPLPQDRRAEAATPYTWKGEAVPGGPHTYPEMAPAGLWTTPTDLARFAIEIQESLAGKSNRVLSASMTREMLTGALGGDYGLGLGIGGGAGHRYFSHGGSNEGYQCLLTAYEDGDGAVIMTNGDAGGALAQQIIRTIAAEYGWPDFRPAERAVAAVDPKSFDSLVGVYRLSPGTICAITREGDRLFTQITGQPSFRLFPMSEREFFLTVVDARVTFPPDVEGRAPELIIHQNGHEAHAKRLSDAESQSIAERRAATEKPAPAPAWKLRDLDGNLVSSEQFKGKVLVVDFWATWCAGCVSEMPGYESLQGKYAKEGVVFVGISMDGDAGVAKKFIAKHGITYQIVMADKDVAPAFGVDSMPGTFIVNRDGMIVDRKTGVVVETPDFEKALLKVLKPTAPGS